MQEPIRLLAANPLPLAALAPRTGPAPAASSSSAPKPPTSGTTGSGTYTSSNYAAPPPPRYGGTGGGGGTYGGPTAQRRLFMMHLALLVLGVWSVVPLLPGGRRAYVFLLRCSIMAQVRAQRH